MPQNSEEQLGEVCEQNTHPCKAASQCSMGKKHRRVSFGATISSECMYKPNSPAALMRVEEAGTSDKTLTSPCITYQDSGLNKRWHCEAQSLSASKLSHEEFFHRPCSKKLKFDTSEPDWKTLPKKQFSRCPV